MRGKGTGIMLATTAALLMTSSSFALDNTTSTHVKPVKCYGINSCRGKGQCGTKTNNACAGQNGCKGKGWLYLSADECKKKGGEILK